MTEVKTIAVNRRARFDYEVLESVEAGLVLTGPEIKAIRAGRISLREAYGRPLGGELWLVGAHIAEYTAGAAADGDAERDVEGGGQPRREERRLCRDLRR